MTSRTAMRDGLSLSFAAVSAAATRIYERGTSSVRSNMMMKALRDFARLVLAAGCLLALHPATAGETTLIRFQLEGHDSKTYTQQSWAGRPLLVLHSDRDGADLNKGKVLSRPIVNLFADGSGKVMVLGVSDLRAVPWLFRGMARGMVKPDADDPVRLRLCDWSGEFARRYELAAATYYVLLFDGSRQLLYRKSVSTADKNQLDVVLAELRPLAQLLSQ